MTFMCADKIPGEILLIAHNSGYLEEAVIIVSDNTV